MNDPVDQQKVSESHSEGQIVGTGCNRENMLRLALAVLIGVALGNSVYAQQSNPLAPAQPLADGWEKMDERLIFLMARLVDVEANLDAVDAAIAKSGGRAASARSAANRAEAGSDRMDRRAGGPVRWDQFYGRTAEKLFYHPTDNHTYHTRTILSQQAPSNDNQSGSGVPSRQGLPVHQRPPQFDYMYRANENAKERAAAEVAKIANKVDALAARRAELELEQSKLWCEVAFRVVSRNDLDKKPLYRFMPKGSEQESLTAAASFVVVALSIVKSGESDQGSAFRQIKPLVSKARSDLGDKWLQLGVNYQDQSSDEWKFATLARHLEDVSSNLSDSYSVSIESARNSDNDRRDMYRGLLQKSLVQYAEAVLALNEMANEMANAKGFEPDLEMPIAMRIDSYASPKTTDGLAKSMRTGSLATLAPQANVESNEVSIATYGNPVQQPYISSSVSFLTRLNLKGKAEEGQWQVQQGKLVGLAAPSAARVTLGEIPFEEYDLSVEFMYVMSIDSSDIIFYLPTLERSLCVRQTKNNQTLVGFFGGGKGLGDNRICVTLPGALALQTKHKLAVKVRKDEAEIILNGKIVKSIRSFDGIEKQDGNLLRVVLSPKAKVVFNVIDVVGAAMASEKSSFQKSPLVGR